MRHTNVSGGAGASGRKKQCFVSTEEGREEVMKAVSREEGEGKGESRVRGGDVDEEDGSCAKTSRRLRALPPARLV